MLLNGNPPEPASSKWISYKSSGYQTGRSDADDPHRLGAAHTTNHKEVT
jgi:hypothetical protein